MMKNERIRYLDYAKAIAIIFVISIHVGFYQINSIVLFAMPLFFLVTGYSFNLGKRRISENISLRFKKVMLPFWIFMLVYTGIELVRAYLFGYGNYEIIFPSIAKAVYGSGIIPFETSITAYLKEILSYKAQPMIGVDVILPTNCHLWFLPAAFTGYVMFVSLVEYTKKNNWAKAISVLCLLFIASIEVVFPSVCQLPFGIGRGAIGAAFMLVGYWLKDNNFFEKKPIIYEIVICVVSALIYIAALFFGSDGSALVRSIYGSYGALSVCLTFIGGVCGAVLLLQLCRGIEKIPFERIKGFLSFLGQNVMTFYLLHMLVKFVLDAIYIVLLNNKKTILLDEYKMALMTGTSFKYMVLEVVVIIAVCFLVVKLLQSIKMRTRKN